MTKKITIKYLFENFTFEDIVEVHLKDGRRYIGKYYGWEFDDEYLGDYIYFSPFDANFDVVAIANIEEIHLIERPDLQLDWR